MTSLRIIATPVVVLVANIFLFAGVAWNRSGTPTAEITFNQCELRALYGSSLKKRRIKNLYLRPKSKRLDRKLLEEFSFPHMTEKGARYFAKAAWVVIEHDGDAWQAYLEKNRGKKDFVVPKLKLLIVDAGRDAKQLRQKYSDRSRYIIVRGVAERRVVRAKSEKIATVVARGLDYDLSITSRFRPELLEMEKAAGKRHITARGNYVKTPECEPTHNIIVKWGQRYEPWLDKVVPLPTS